MGKYTLCHSLKCTGDLRVKDVLLFLQMMQNAFGASGWVDSDDNGVELSQSGIERMLITGYSEAELRRAGALQVLKSADLCPPVIATIRTGGDEGVSNHFNVDFPSSAPLEYVRRLIELVPPTETSISEA